MPKTDLKAENRCLLIWLHLSSCTISSDTFFLFPQKKQLLGKQLIWSNTDPRKLTISTDFLEAGKNYEVRIYEDDDQVKTRTKVRVSTKKKVKAGSSFTFSLKGSGGAAMHFLPME